MRWRFIGLSKPAENPLDGWLGQRLARLETVLAARDWPAAGRFTAAGILMADVLRVPAVWAALAGHGALRAYVARACARPAFGKARRDQLAHFAAADAARGGG